MDFSCAILVDNIIFGCNSLSAPPGFKFKKLKTMTSENLETIMQNLQFWKDLCDNKDSKIIAKTLGQGVGFYFLIPKEAKDQIHAEKKKRSLTNDETCYHAYAGVSKEGVLNYYLIHSVHDTEEQYEKGIRPYIIECKISDNYDGADNAISNAEARLLIDNWKNYHEEWIPSQTASSDGMYRAFSIPDEDIPTDELLKGFFGLKGDTSTFSFDADLVFTDLKNELVHSETFSDLARPVPPFKPGVDASENFFLLTCPVPDEYL